MNTDIKDFENKHSGRCWIVGNGPSLNDTPLELLDGEISFGMNSISLIFDSTEWRPSYYCCFQRTTPPPKVIDRMKPLVDLNIPCIITSRLAPMNMLEHFPMKQFDNVYAMSVASIEYRTPNEFDWSDNGFWLFGYATTLYAVAQVACYMGFDEIFLVGCDMGWRGFEAGDDVNHFHPDYNKGLSMPLSDVEMQNMGERMYHAHDALKKRCDERGVKVFNATRGGELEIYPRVNLDDVIGLQRQV